VSRVVLLLRLLSSGGEFIKPTSFISLEHLMIDSTTSQTAKSIPVTTWAVINALSLDDPDHLPALLSEIEICTNDGQIDMPRLTKQSHLDCLLKGTYRLVIHSPEPRTVTDDTQIGSYSLRKGSLVTVHSRALQLSPTTWGPDPLVNPQHFQSKDIISKQEKDDSRKK
jgi:hypothetical protein